VPLVPIRKKVVFSVPLLTLLARLKFFSSGHPWSGFQVEALSGDKYKGRFSFRSVDQSVARNRKSAAESQKRQTIAERKAASNDGGDK
jgi:preprotein translocase subunit SecD